jgi:pimeloyl-ACP methyl ester carboxylesterase
MAGPRSSVRVVTALALGALLLAAACSDDPALSPPGPGGGAVPSGEGRVDVGGYELAYTCVGAGSPTVILEAGLGASGMSEFLEVMPEVQATGAQVCTYDRAGIGASEARPTGEGLPTALTHAEELHTLLAAADISPPYVLVPHSYGGLVARMFADRYPETVAGFVFEDVSTAWEIDLWPRWDDRPWIDGEQKVDIGATEQLVLDAAPFGQRPAIVLSQSTYDGEGVPKWAADNFAQHQAKLAALGADVIHVRAEDTGHWIHLERPALVVAAIAEVVRAVRDGTGLAPCDVVFDGGDATCL